MDTVKQLLNGRPTSPCDWGLVIFSQHVTSTQLSIKHYSAVHAYNAHCSAITDRV